MTKNTMAVKLPFWATLLTILGLSVLCTLGTWQLQRLTWKTDILQKIEAEYEKDAFQNRITSRKLAEEELNLSRGLVKGHYYYHQNFLVGPRTNNGKPGYHLYTPMVLIDGGALLINRGWVPLDWNKDEKNIAKKSRVAGVVAGLFREPPEPNIFTPDNIPEKDIWYRLDLDQIADAKDIPRLAPVILYAENPEAAPGEPPITAATRPHLNNNHLQYAIFWFAMAAALIVIYVLRFLIKT